MSGHAGEKRSFSALVLVPGDAEKSGLDHAGERHGFFGESPIHTAVELDICGQKLDAKQGWRSMWSAASGVMVLLGGGRVEDPAAFYVLSGSTVDTFSSVGHHPEVEHKFLPVLCTKFAASFGSMLSSLSAPYQELL